MNHLVRIFSERTDTKFKDKYTEQIYTINELMQFVKAMINLNTIEEDKDWFERFEKI